MGIKRHTTPIADSPWFWAFLYASVGIVVLVGFSAKYSARQAQLERQFLARQFSGQSTSHPAMPGALADEKTTFISLRPILLVLGVVAVVAWPLIWWKLRRAKLRDDVDNPITRMSH